MTITASPLCLVSLHFVIDPRYVAIERGRNDRGEDKNANAHEEFKPSEQAALRYGENFEINRGGGVAASSVRKGQTIRGILLSPIPTFPCSTLPLSLSLSSLCILSSSRLIQKLS